MAKKKLTPQELGALPLSEQLQIATDDLRALRKLKSYCENHNAIRETYRDGKGKKVCTVCMAGAALDRTCGLRDDNAAVDAFADVSGIDSMRRGELPRSRWCTITHTYNDIPGVDVAIASRFAQIVSETYNEDRGRATLATYDKAARYLRSMGL